MKSVSELRQDLVSGDWVVIATGRAKRPQDFSKQKRDFLRQPKKSCPFEFLSDRAISSYALSAKKPSWHVQVIPNKFPAFGEGNCSLFYRIGPYQSGEGVGFHEVIVTRDHDRPLARMNTEEVELVVRAYQDRYLALKDKDCVEYISIFHNHGAKAGATIAHPHSQLIALPVIPPDIARSLSGSANYFHANKRCVHCDILKFELKDKKRAIYENSFFAVLAPFASRTAFELRIFPKKHQPHFEHISSEDRMLLADAIQTALNKIYKGLKNPDFNFFIHTAPAQDPRKFGHYHWHFEIIPKTSVWAGFEIGTGIEISVIAPENAAAFLKKIKT